MTEESADTPLNRVWQCRKSHGTQCEQGQTIGHRSPIGAVHVLCAALIAVAADLAALCSSVGLGQSAPGTPHYPLLACFLAHALAAVAIVAGAGIALRISSGGALTAGVLADQLAALERDHQALLKARERDSERAAGLVRMNADLVGVQLELESNYRVIEEMNAQLERLATMDALTSIPNRRVFEEMLEAQIGLARAGHEPVSIMLLDVDRFKQYNDTYGHIEGDDLLHELAQLLRDEVRDTDLATRYGGEEFAVLLPMTGIEQAASIAERVRVMIEGHRFANGQVTVSIGVATTTCGSDDPHSLLVAADVALYQAKAAGRNRVVLAGADAPRPTGASPTATSGNHQSPGRRRGRRSGDSIRLLYSDSLGGIEGLVQQPSGTILSALLAALDLRDHETEGHSQRVARYALRLGIELSQLDPSVLPNRSKYLLDPGDIRELALGAMLHDIGKLHVPDAILRKNGPLDEQEWLLMKRHPAVGADLVSRFADLAPAATVVRYHHERWDGNGYPEKRVGTSIPLVARLFAVCDTLDAITSDRPYRAARPFSAAIEEISRCSGQQFDPVIVDAFLQVRTREWEMLAAGDRPVEQALAA